MTAQRPVGAAVAAVPMHPEATADPAVLRWVIPAGLMAFVGPVGSVPGVLAELVDDGTVVHLTVEPGAVLITLGPSMSWREQGARVRSALSLALSDIAAWVPAEAEASSTDARLRAAVEGVIAGGVGDYIRSHGGRVRLLCARDHRATVALEGECEGCPARGFTLALRFERAVRAWYPDLVAVDIARG